MPDVASKLRDNWRFVAITEKMVSQSIWIHFWIMSKIVFSKKTRCNQQSVVWTRSFFVEGTRPLSRFRDMCLQLFVIITVWYIVRIYYHNNCARSCMIDAQVLVAKAKFLTLRLQSAVNKHKDCLINEAQVLTAKPESWHWDCKWFW